MESNSQEPHSTTEQENSNQLFSFNANKKFITANPEHPELYTKMAIQLFSAFFSTIFGAFLLLSNIKKQEDSFQRMIILIFGIGYTILVVVIVNNMTQSIGLMPLLLNSIGGTVLTEVFWNKYIGKETLHRKKKIWKPLIISLLISAPFILASIYLAMNQ